MPKYVGHLNKKFLIKYLEELWHFWGVFAVLGTFEQFGHFLELFSTLGTYGQFWALSAVLINFGQSVQFLAIWAKNRPVPKIDQNTKSPQSSRDSKSLRNCKAFHKILSEFFWDLCFWQGTDGRTGPPEVVQDFLADLKVTQFYQ